VNEYEIHAQAFQQVLRTEQIRKKMRPNLRIIRLRVILGTDAIHDVATVAVEPSDGISYVGQAPNPETAIGRQVPAS
jgi:hypothetical protein